MFFDSWSGLIRIACLAPLAYAVLVLVLRISGKRTLAKMNAFDLVVTVALGSTLASVVTSSRIPFAEGALSLVLLVLLQYGVSWASVRSSTVKQAFKSEPQLLFYDGHFMYAAMRGERVGSDDVLQAMRSEGFIDLTAVQAVVLESDGTFSVIGKGEAASDDGSTMKGVGRTEDAAPVR